MKFVFRSRDLEEIKATLRFLGLEPEDEENQRRIRELENGQCLFQDTKGHTGVMQVHPVFQEYLDGFDTKPPTEDEVIE